MSDVVIEAPLERGACPFCHCYHVTLMRKPGAPEYWCCCDECGSCGPRCAAGVAACLAWNRRGPPRRLKPVADAISG